MKDYILIIYNSILHQTYTKYFVEKEQLFDYKKYGNVEIKDAELSQIDKNGYVWFIEI